DDFGLSRRQAIWNAGYTDSPDRVPGTAIVAPPPMLPGMSDVELTLADLESTKISPSEHPFAHLRPMLTQQGILAVGGLIHHEPDRRIRVAGLITHRQRPYTAGGVTFLNLEDETGMLNVVVFDAVWQRHRAVARSSAAVVIRGRLEHQQGAVNLVAETLERLLDPAVPRGHRSRDYR